MKHIREIIKLIIVNKERLTRASLFLAILAVTYFLANYFPKSLFFASLTLLAIELSIIFIVIWAIAGHAVIKSLFLVGASMSLIIFIAQSYCDLPSASRTGDDALRILLAFGFAFVVFQFVSSITKELDSRLKKYKEIYKVKKSWALLILLAVGTGLFIEQVLAVIGPIVQNLCVYK
jgi:hypothetical protein